MSGGSEGGERSSNKGSEQEPEERTDGWMNTYADMVTLLMTFFVLMFAISNVDAQKVALVFAGMSRDGLSLTQYNLIMDMYAPGGDGGEMPIIGGGWEDDKNQEEEPPDEGSEGDGTNPELDELYNRINSYIELSGLTDSMLLHYDGDMLLVTLANDIWFQSGSADVLEPMRESAAILGHLLADTQNPDRPFEIIVEGHTDNVPVVTPRYPDNWWLGSARANSFLRLLIDESGLSIDYFTARTYGETRPIGDNTTAAGRQMNRRVEIKITVLRESEAKPVLKTNDNASLLYDSYYDFPMAG